MQYNVYPLYLCNKERDCANDEGCSDEFCTRTTCPAFAKNPESVELYNKFFDTFKPITLENGAIIGYEEKE